MAQGRVRHWAWHERRALVDACAVPVEVEEVEAGR